MTSPVLRIALLACAVLAPVAVQAQPNPSSGTAARVPVLQADYTGYAHGLVVLKMHVSLALGPKSYGLSLGYHTAGVVGILVHSAVDSSVQGFFDTHDAPEPLRFSSAGTINGQPRRTILTYKDGTPQIDALEPPPDSERQPVPASDQAHTVDSLSAMAGLLHQVALTGRCDGTARTFDGQRLGDVTAATVGEETLAPTDRSSFSGRTLRCDFVGHQLAGFKRNEDLTTLKKPHQATAWLAALQPGQPLVPVRVVFDHRVLGETTLYINAAPAS